MPQAMSLLKPMATPNAPGKVTPNVFFSGVASCMANHMDGRFKPRCGSLARMAFPVADFEGATAQLLLPLSGFGS